MSHSNINIVEKYQNTVRAAVNQLLLSRRIQTLPVERDDLYQVGWIALLECMDKFDPSRGAKFETYVSRVIRNAVIKEINKQLKKRMNPLTIDKSYEPEFDEALHFINWLLDKIENEQILNRVERTIFTLRYFDENTFEDIGNRVGVSRETARKSYYQSVNKIKEAYNNE